MYPLMFVGGLVLLFEAAVLAVLLVPFIPRDLKNYFKDFLAFAFGNKYSMHVISILAASFTLLFVHNVSIYFSYSRPPPVAPGVPPPPPNVETVKTLYESQGTAFLLFFIVYLFWMIWSVMMTPESEPEKPKTGSPAVPAKENEEEEEKKDKKEN